jgi:EmrB/QacA subfamily drug resistance transporter
MAAPPPGPVDSGVSLSHQEIGRIVLGLMLALFLAAVDQTLIAMSLLAMGRDLGNIDLMPWVMSGYLVASTIATPIYGKLSDLYGRWPVMASAIILFFVACLLCSVAQSMPQLIACRVLQGIGGGALIGLVQTSIADVAPGAERGRYQAYMSGVFASASILGPVIGGLITEYLSWRAIFLINLPLGVLAYLLARRALARLPVRTRSPRPIDFAGAVLLAGGLGTLMIGLTRLGQGVAWHAASSLALFAAGISLLGLFALREHHAPDPLIPLSLFRQGVVLGSLITLFLLFFALLGQTVLLPMWLQALHGIGLEGVALRMLPYTLATPAGAMVAGKMILRGAALPRLMLVGMVGNSVATATLALISADSAVIVTAVMMLSGFTLGLALPTGLVIVQGTVPKTQMGVATATAALSRTLGGAMGVALLTAILFASLGLGGSGGAEALREALASGEQREALASSFRLTLFVISFTSAMGALIALAMPRHAGR